MTPMEKKVAQLQNKLFKKARREVVKQFPNNREDIMIGKWDNSPAIHEALEFIKLIGIK